MSVLSPARQIGKAHRPESKTLHASGGVGVPLAPPVTGQKLDRLTLAGFAEGGLEGRTLRRWARSWSGSEGCGWPRRSAPTGGKNNNSHE